MRRAREAHCESMVQRLSSAVELYENMGDVRHAAQCREGVKRYILELERLKDQPREPRAG